MVGLSQCNDIEWNQCSSQRKGAASSQKIDTIITTKDAIDVVHRLKGKPKTYQNKKFPSIIVRFIARKTRNLLLSSLQLMKKMKAAEFNDPHIDRVFINENLGPVKKTKYNKTH